mgnify:CR=1 FL=1
MRSCSASIRARSSAEAMAIAESVPSDNSIFDYQRVYNAPELYSGITGFGQDTMSHMRLFGIALSGSIMAMVVNQIAGLFPTVVTILFAVVGHFFVYFLALLSLYIHTNRLIFLEFGSKCFAWSSRPATHGSPSRILATCARLKIT